MSWSVRGWRKRSRRWGRAVWWGWSVVYWRWWGWWIPMYYYRSSLCIHGWCRCIDNRFRVICGGRLCVDYWGWRCVHHRRGRGWLSRRTNQNTDDERSHAVSSESRRCQRHCKSCCYLLHIVTSLIFTITWILCPTRRSSCRSDRRIPALEDTGL